MWFDVFYRKSLSISEFISGFLYFLWAVCLFSVLHLNSLLILSWLEFVFVIDHRKDCRFFGHIWKSGFIRTIYWKCSCPGPLLWSFVEKTESMCVVTSKLSIGFYYSVEKNICKYHAVLITVILGYILKVDHKLFPLCFFLFPKTALNICCALRCCYCFPYRI